MRVYYSVLRQRWMILASNYIDTAAVVSLDFDDGESTRSWGNLNSLDADLARAGLVRIEDNAGRSRIEVAS